MILRDVYITAISAFLATLLIFLTVHITTAQVMQSASYRIQTDSINFGGGLSTSTNYTLESTAGEIATGDSTGTNFNLRAGYQQLTGSFISMSAPAPVTMSPSIPGITGGTSNGSTTVTVTTDSPAGYTLSIKSDTAPAMVSGANSIADYVPAGANPDYDFATTSSGAFFGYTPSGINVSSRFRDNGVTCGISSGEVALKCWDGLDTADKIIATATSGNSPVGATTTISFRVSIGPSVSQVAGTYIATTTLTALSL